jgi:alkylhydroperoxidase family enzyme
MTREAAAMTDADVAALRAHWSEGEAVEIAAVVGTFNYFNRFNDAFGVEPTKPGEGLES